MKIRKRILGRTQLEVTEVGLGGIPIIGASFDKAVKIVNRALDLGINYIDTARGYRDSEAKIGEVMKKRRDECILATKTGKLAKEGAREDIRESLKALKTKRVDILQLHDVSTRQMYQQMMGPGGALEALKEARDKGKTRFIGISSHNVKVLEKAIRSGEFDTVVLVYNLGVNNTNDRVIPLAKKKGVGVVIMKPLSGGVFFRLTKGKNRITPEIAWRFVLSNPNISVALGGAKWVKDVEQNVRIAKNWKPIAQEEAKKYIGIAQSLGEKVCRGCRYCIDCPQGIDIPAIMQMLDRASVYSYESPAFRTVYGRLKRDYTDCLECGKCEKKCPFKLPIIERLKKAKEMFDREV